MTSDEQAAQIESEAGEAPAIQVKQGNVVRRKDGRKYVAARDHEAKGVEIVCSSPHADGDFSYCCGSDWCRCMQ